MILDLEHVVTNNCGDIVKIFTKVTIKLI